MRCNYRNPAPSDISGHWNYYLQVLDLRIVTFPVPAAFRWSFRRLLCVIATQGSRVIQSFISLVKCDIFSDFLYGLFRFLILFETFFPWHRSNSQITIFMTTTLVFMGLFPFACKLQFRWEVSRSCWYLITFFAEIFGHLPLGLHMRPIPTIVISLAHFLCTNCVTGLIRVLFYTISWARASTNLVDLAHL